LKFHPGRNVRLLRNCLSHINDRRLMVRTVFDFCTVFFFFFTAETATGLPDNEKINFVAAAMGCCFALHFDRRTDRIFDRCAACRSERVMHSNRTTVTSKHGIGAAMCSINVSQVIGFCFPDGRQKPFRRLSSRYLQRGQ
jgi:hypothetical protein